MLEKLEFSPREAETLRLICQGFDTSGIAETMRISINTVKVRIQDILSHVGVRNRLELLLWTLEHPDALKGMAIVSDHPPDCPCGCRCFKRILDRAA